jgi:hypothetical protein
VLILAAALTVYVAWIDESRGLAALAGVAGVALILAAVLVAWDDGLVVGSALLLVAYALSLADRGEAVDRAAPLVAVALLAVVDFGSWSLELRDGAEERPLARLPSVFLLLGAALAASTLVLTVGGVSHRRRPRPVGARRRGGNRTTHPDRTASDRCEV